MKKQTIILIVISLITTILIVTGIYYVLNDKTPNTDKEQNNISQLNTTQEINNTYSKNTFYARVIESNREYMIVEPFENEEIKKSSDKISINLGQNNDAIYEVGTNLKIKHTGIIKETYPAQISVISMEIKSAETFEIIYEQRKDLGIETIIDKNQQKNYTYNIYSYGGDVFIKINNGEKIELRQALLDNKITMDEIIQKANQDESENKITAQIYKDGGSKIYTYSNYSIIKCHNLSQNRDVYIGMKDMKIDDIKK